MLYRLSEVRKRFGSRTVLDIDRLEFEERRVHALIGANGAGKTTLLNHLAFLEKPSSGEIVFRGRAVSYDRQTLNQCRRQVVLVDQTPILFSGTVFQNVGFGLKVRGVERAERAARIAAALEQVGLASFADYDINGLSGGEVKRVALARALAVEPQVLLCDEPTANVDQEHQEIILKILRHANSVKHTSIIFSTHHLSQSRRLADRTVMLEHGRVIEESGENIFTGRLLATAAPKPLVQLSANCRFHLDPGQVPPDRGNGSIRVQLLPNLLDLEPMNADDSRGCTGTVTVTQIGLEGRTVRVRVETGIALTAYLDLDRYRSAPLLVGQRVWMRIPPEAVVIL